MAWHDKMTDDEIEFIRETFPQLSTAEIAHRLGRSKRTVNKYVAELGLREPRARASCPQEAPGEEDGTGDRLEELRWLAATIRRALLEGAAARDIPKLSAEYRATLEEIGKLEADDDADVADGGIAGLIASVSLSRAKPPPGAAL